MWLKRMFMFPCPGSLVFHTWHYSIREQLRPQSLRASELHQGQGPLSQGCQAPSRPRGRDEAALHTASLHRTGCGGDESGPGLRL